MANYHVSPDKENKRWRIIRENSGKASGFGKTQREAEQLAKRLAGNSGGGEVRIHGLNGKIRDSDTVPPAKDPCPPKDRKH